ncbi:DUF1707 SHOCT-like domain-containing protein [Streptomyces morookaense]|uniref:DUF1707 domain-containing protein n=1 Tax=Streptomyces morookaense TaxID=1970 RepID=A0A7Y7EAM2_STRMO|nr:DUF1707 domain-containing protein [Streptomyces morookaense]NVK82260.1 DUF1707 domain-containing protein [Streptomyces morookaense]GHF53591.1 hypothetical protein GCM10010359_64900 [Streptomyces morookaense]
MVSELPESRASHEDRDRVVDVLRIAMGDGRLTAEELDDRLEKALSARTLGELAALTADLPAASAAGDVLVVEQRGGKWARSGRWSVPARIELRARLCRVTLDFTDAAITSGTLRIDADMQHSTLFVVGLPGMLIDTDGLALEYSTCRLRSGSAAGTDPRFRIELAGTLRHSKVVERRPRRRAAGPFSARRS